MRRILVGLLLGLVVLAAVAAVRTARFRVTPHGVEPLAPIAVDAAAVAARLAAAIRIPTLSYDEPEAFDLPAFERLLAFLERSYPALHGALERERVDRASLLLRWPGRDPALAPVVLMAHLDVVPVQPGSEADWEHPPFSGEIADGLVWGRGAFDDKGSLVALCEAVEHLVRSGYRPARTVYLAFGHDEETGGVHGAARIAALLHERGIAPELVLDEGGVIALPGVLPGVQRPVAMVGIAEKGYLSLELRVQAEGGHSSQPHPHSAVGILASAIHRLERDRPPRRLTPVSRGLLLAIGPAGGLGMRAVFANLWLTEPFVLRAIGRNPAGDALLRTTTAATMFEGSPKDNVLAVNARAVVNFRILPGETVASVTEHVRQTVADERIELAPYGAFAGDPSPVADTASWSFRSLERTIHEVFPEVLVAPTLVLGATDSRYFAALTPNVFRFAPLHAELADLARVHGTNERVRVEDLAGAVAFYLQLLRNTTGDLAR